MILILTDSFLTKEYIPVSRFFSIKHLNRAAIKCKSSGVEMSNLGYIGAKVIKVRISGKPAGRLVFFVEVENERYIPIVLRLKKDKIFGENLSMQNKKAKKIILERIFSSQADVKLGKYRKYDFS